jgi:non-specific serine/threonine protein kinase
LTVTGAGGCGKTRLALQVATQLQNAETFADGVWLVELASLADPALVPQTVAAAFGVHERPHGGDSRSLVETLVETLRARSLLLLLDNCEHLIETCAQLVEALLRACPQLRILATSREALGIAGETTWLAPSLALPSSQTPPTQIHEVEAVRLFVERASSALPTFQLTAHNVLLVAQICRQLDGIPLAIELAAARVKVLSVEQLAFRLAGALDERFRLLSGGSRTIGRHQTLRAAIDWSFELLSEEERILFRRLAVFAGGFTLEAAESVCSAARPALALPNQGMRSFPQEPGFDVLSLLAHLVDKSLVIVDAERQPTGEVRYRLLETLRQYSRERLCEAGEEETIQERHAQFFLAVVDAADAALNGPDELRTLMRLEAEHDNLREVLRWCQEPHTDPDVRVNLGLQLVAVLWKFWTMRGYHREGFDSMRKLLALPGSTTPPATRLYALNGAGILGQELGDYAAAQLLLEEAAAIATVLGDQTHIASTFLALASNAISQGNLAIARAYAEQSLSIRRQLGNVYDTAQSLVLLGLVPLLQGSYSEAQALFEEGIALLRTRGITNFLAYSLRQLARAMLLQGNVEQAMVNSRESLALNLQLQSQLGIMACLAGFVGILLAHGQLASAAQLSGAVDTLLHSSGLQLLPIERNVYNKNLASLRTQLDEATFAAARKTGSAMTLEQAIAHMVGDPILPA